MIAWLLDQPAAAAVDALLQKADGGNDLHLLMSWINIGEVYYIVARRHGKQKAEGFLQRVPSLPVRVVLPEEEDVVVAARLKSTRRLAYADAFAAALAMRVGAAIVTGDPELSELRDILSVQWIGGY